MKHLFKLFAAASLLAFAFGCTPQEAPISNLTTEFSVAAEATEVPISFNALSDWEASSSEAWVVLSSESGSAGNVKLTAKIAANETFENRSAVVTVTSKSLITEYKITQKMSTAFEVAASYVIDSKSQTIDFALNSNVGYKFVVAEDAKSWISIVNSKAEPSLTIQEIAIQANTGVAPRTGLIAVQAGDTVFGIEITQKADFECLPIAEASCLGRTMRIYDGSKYLDYNEFLIVLRDEENNNLVKLAINTEKDSDIATLPIGQFEVDALDEHTPGTFSIKSLRFNEPEYSSIFVDGSEEILVEDGQIDISVENDVCTIIAAFMDGKENIHRFSYVGTVPAVADKSLGGYISDVTFNGQYDTYFSTKANKWSITLQISKPTSEGALNIGYINLSVFGEAGDNVDPNEIPTGTFILLKSVESDTSLGYNNGVKLYCQGDASSFSCYENNGTITWSINDGAKVTITKNEDGTYKFDFDAEMSRTEYYYNEDYTVLIGTETFEDVFKGSVDGIRGFVDEVEMGLMPTPDGDMVFQSVMNPQAVGMWFGPIAGMEEDCAGGLMIIGFNNINYIYNVYLPLVVAEYTYVYNFNKDKYCNTPIANGTYTFSNTPVDNSVIAIKYGVSLYSYVTNTYTGTQCRISGGSVELKDGSIEYDLKVTNPKNAEIYSVTGSHPYSFYYSRDYVKYAKSISIIAE